MRFYEQFYGFHALKTVGKCTGRHLFRYGGFHTNHCILSTRVASENKLKRIMTIAKNGMESTSLEWNEKKCAVIHVKRGQVEQGSGKMKIADLQPVINSLDQHNTSDNTYKFLGVFENTRQEDKQVL